ncbi:MAG: tetratricopeptide repeat protein [Candidatus Schekmanbacteria bacterium]|nr:tetratricopeptide repeat protein [Candidatus Schekmanbacteria bacterium]
MLASHRTSTTSPRKMAAVLALWCLAALFGWGAADAEQAATPAPAAPPGPTPAVASDSAGAERLHQRARELIREDRLPEAAQLLQQALALDPAAATAKSDLGFVLLKLERPAEAVPILEQARAQLPDEPGILFSLGAAYRLSGKVADALEPLGACLALAPERKEAAYLLGMALLEAKIPANAPAAAPFFAYVDRDDADGRLHYIAGNVHLALGDPDRAIAEYRKAVALDAEIVQAASNLASLYYDRQQYDLAREYYEKGLERVARAIDKGKPAPKEYAPAFYNLGNCLFRLGLPDDAVAAFRRAILLDPEYQLAYVSLGNILFQRGQLADAEAAYRTALSFDASSPLAHFNLSSALLGQGKLEEAREHLEAIARRGDFPRAQYRLGDYYRLKGDAAAAIAAYEKGIQDDPEHADAAAYGHLFGLYVSGNDAAQVLPLADSALARSANDPAIRGLVARAHLALHQEDRAAEILEKLLAEHPERRETRHLRGSLQARRGDLAAADKSLAAAYRQGKAPLDALSWGLVVARLGQDKRALELADEGLAALGAPARAGESAVVGGDLLMLRGSLLERKGERKKAIEAYRAALDSDEQGARPWYAAALAAAQEHAGDAAGAAETLRRCVQTAAGNAQCQYALARHEAREGHWQGAAERLRRMLAADPRCRVARVALARVLAANGEKAAGAAELEAAVSEPETPAGGDSEGNPASRCALGDPLSAADLAVEAARMHLGAGAPDRALAALSRLSTPLPPQAEALLVETARSLLATGSTPAALAAANRAMELGGESAALLELVALASFKLGDLTAATRAIERAVQLEASNAAIRNNAAAIAIASHHQELADAHLQVAKNLVPLPAAVLRNLGIQLERQRGNAREAVDAYAAYLAAGGADRALVESWVRALRAILDGAPS